MTENHRQTATQEEGGAYRESSGESPGKWSAESPGKSPGQQEARSTKENRILSLREQSRETLEALQDYLAALAADGHEAVCPSAATDGLEEERLEKAVDFITSTRFFGWQGALKRLREQDVIITTPLLKQALAKVYEPTTCGVMTGDCLQAAINHYAGRVILLLPKGEQAVRRFLAKHRPKRRVFSALTDLLPNSLHRPAGFNWRHKPESIAKDKSASRLSPVLIVGAPGSEVSFFADIYRRVGLGTARPYFPKSLLLFKAMGGRFPLARFMQRVETRYAEGGAYSAWLYSDVLNSLLEERLVSSRRLIAYLTRRGVKVIYYSMRDKIRQAVYAAKFDMRLVGSVWELSQTGRKNYRLPKLLPSRLFGRLFPLIEQDLEAEALISLFPTVHMVVHEDLIMAPKEVLAGVGAYLGRSVDVSVEMDWRQVMMSLMPELDDEANRLTRFVIDRLGLHTNAAGSLVSLQQLVNEVVEERMAQQAESG